MLSEHVLSLAQRIWDYHHMGHTLMRSDCILVLGSHDLRVAERGAQLYLDGWAPLLIMSGGLGNLTRGLWAKSEAELFAEVARNMGVLEDRILVEPRSTNTGENIQFTRALLEERGLAPESFIVVQKPYMERRSFATFRKVWPEKTITITSPPISLRDYPNDEITMEDVINIMVGDLQRIMLYPALGYQIAQDVPDDVRQAYEALIDMGFTRHLARADE